MPGRQDDDLAVGAVDWQCVYKASGQAVGISLTEWLGLAGRLHSVHI